MIGGGVINIGIKDPEVLLLCQIQSLLGVLLLCFPHGPEEVVKKEVKPDQHCKRYEQQ